MSVKQVFLVLLELLLCVQEELEVDEYVWRYIKKYHTDKVQSICSPGVQCTYTKDIVSQKLEVAGGNVDTVKTATEEIVSLCQNLLEHIMEETFQLPQDTHEDMLQTAKDLAENEKMLFYISDNSTCHVVGPKDNISVLKQRILDVISASVKKTEGTDRNRERFASETGKASLASESTPDRYSVITPGGIMLEVYQGNLVAETVDAIVNPANSHLRHGSGAARAIADAAGLQLQNECRNFIKQHRCLDVTKVMHTSAGYLNPKIRYVIHAVGPQAAKYSESTELFQALKETFINCLQYAEVELRISSLSIPAISSGTYYCCFYLILYPTNSK